MENWLLDNMLLLGIVITLFLVGTKIAIGMVFKRLAQESDPTENNDR